MHSCTKCLARIAGFPVPRCTWVPRVRRGVALARLPKVRSLRRLPCGHDYDGSPSGRRLGLQPPVFERVHRCLGWSRQQRSICSICSICSIVVSYVCMQQSARGTAYWRWGPFLNVSSSCTCSDSPQRRQAGLSAPLSSPVLAVVFTAVPVGGFLMPMQCDACRRAEPRSEKTCDDRVSPIGLRPAGSSLDLADSGRSPPLR